MIGRNECILQFCLVANGLKYIGILHMESIGVMNEQVTWKIFGNKLDNLLISRILG